MRPCRLLACQPEQELLALGLQVGYGNAKGHLRLMQRDAVGVAQGDPLFFSPLGGV